jgi:hypothetical protein
MRYCRKIENISASEIFNIRNLDMLIITLSHLTVHQYINTFSCFRKPVMGKWNLSGAFCICPYIKTYFCKIRQIVIGLCVQVRRLCVQVRRSCSHSGNNLKFNVKSFIKFIFNNFNSIVYE